MAKFKLVSNSISWLVSLDSLNQSISGTNWQRNQMDIYAGGRFPNPVLPTGPHHPLSWFEAPDGTVASLPLCTIE